MDSDGVTDMDSDGMNVSDGMNDADGEGGHGMLGESSRHQRGADEYSASRGPRRVLYETGGDHAPLGGRAGATRRRCGLTRKREKCSERVRFE